MADRGTVVCHAPGGLVIRVALDAMGRVESHGLMRTYAKFLK